MLVRIIVDIKKFTIKSRTGFEKRTKNICPFFNFEKKFSKKKFADPCFLPGGANRPTKFHDNFRCIKFFRFSRKNDLGVFYTTIL
jgi:hypothetical protein